MSTRVTSKGQVTIPIEIRRAAHVTEGTQLEWAYDPVGRRIVASKRGARPRRKHAGSHCAQLRGTATPGGMTTDEIMALTRGDIDE